MGGGGWIVRWVFWVVSVHIVWCNEGLRDFLARNSLQDGEIETRVRFRGISAKETAVIGGRKSIKFRQLTDGTHFIQLIYDEDDILEDCEFSTDRHQIHLFLDQFREDLHQLQTASNLTITSLDEGYRAVPRDIHTWLNYGKLRTACKRKQLELKEMLRLRELESGQPMGDGNEASTPPRASLDTHQNVAVRDKRHTLAAPAAASLPKDRHRTHNSLLIFPGMQWCGLSDRAAKYTDLGRYAGTDRCCRKHDICRLSIPGNRRRYRLANNSPITKSHCFCDNSSLAGGGGVGRTKRDMSDFLRMPGTRWCGKGYSATEYVHLGGFSSTDRCCRVHDTKCPLWIGGFQEKYGLFNWRLNTLMHCNCDKRFRTCLKVVGSSDANLIGKIFFNVVQTKCFILKKKKICMRRSWWGKKCLKSKVVEKAILRKNFRY